jgi:hypothetical protein
VTLQVPELSSFLEQPLLHWSLKTTLFALRFDEMGTCKVTDKKLSLEELWQEESVMVMVVVVGQTLLRI